MVIELNDESLLANVGRDTLQLKSLENGPIEEFLMSGSEFPQVLDHALIVVASHWLLLGSGDLRSGVLANHFVGRPMALLAVR